MAKIPILGGFYVAPSLIANAQRCVNLYPEKNTEDAPFPITCYQRPGLGVKFTLIAGRPVRCLYRASTGELYAACGPNVYYVDSSWVPHVIGTIDDGNNIVSMSDNRLVVVVVDGTTKGYYIDLTNNRAFGQIVATAFYGADKVDFIDTFFVFNRPGTNQFYISASELSATLILGGGVGSGTIVGGFSYTSGTHPSVPLTGGSGSGAVANITVTSNSVTAVQVAIEGINYQVGDILGVGAGALSGAILTQSIVSGTGYTVAGTYTAVPLTGGTGSLATATVVVAGNVVLSATMVSRGQDYTAGDVLTCSAALLGGSGAGFQVVVATVATSGSGFSYTLTSVDAGIGAFDSLDIAAKTGSSDTLVTLGVMHDDIWLIGQLTTEVWNDTGAADFTFGKIGGVFVQHGCIAVYSVAQTDLSLFWLGQEREGARIVFKGSPYNATRISTHAIEKEFQGYSTVSDAIGFTYQMRGHSFYVLTFPTADKTWAFDLATDLWHEWTWTDSNGAEHRHRANCAAYVYGVNIVGDWQNGRVYVMDQTLYTDAGGPIVYRRGFPHLVNEGKRISYDSLLIEMDVGTSRGTTSANTVYALVEDTGADALIVDPAADALIVYNSADTPPPSVSLWWSDTKGASWGNPIELSIGATGEYLTSIQANQLGMARDRVFEVFWSGDFSTALNGMYIFVSPAEN